MKIRIKVADDFKLVRAHAPLGVKGVHFSGKPGPLATGAVRSRISFFGFDNLTVDLSNRHHDDPERLATSVEPRAEAVMNFSSLWAEWKRFRGDLRPDDRGPKTED
jgi:hypothetical protein